MPSVIQRNTMTTLTIPSDLSIPDWLKFSPEMRKSAWVGHDYTDPHTGGSQEAWRVKEEERRRADAAKKKEKNAAAFARMQAKHPGEVYNRAMKMWVPETKGE